MYEIHATFEGLVPMLHDRFFDPEQVEKGGSKKKGKDAWKKELELSAYFDKKGVYLPADNIRMMLIGNSQRRGAAQILGSDIESSKGTKYKSLCEGCIFVRGKDDPQKVYLDPKRKFNPNDYDERAFPDKNGQRHLKRRPLFKTPWRLHFIIDVADDRVDESFVRELFDVAGTRCGAGAYGPTFGRCIITRWDVRKGNLQITIKKRPTKPTIKNHSRAKSHGKKKVKRAS